MVLMHLETRLAQQFSMARRWARHLSEVAEAAGEEAAALEG